MKTLRDLRRFILARSAEGNQSDVRSYVADNVHEVARAFHVSVETIASALESVPHDDAALASKLLETIRRAEALVRRHQRESRRRSAQASADALSSATRWKDDRAQLDLPSLLSSALTRRDDLLVFQCDTFTVAVHMAPLLDLAKVHRVRHDLSGWVDATGLQLRWGRGGGLNLRPQDDPSAARVILHLPPPCRAAVIAA